MLFRSVRLYTLIASYHKHHSLTPSLADVARASAKAKGEMPGRTNEAEKKASEVGTEIGQKIDSAVRIQLFSYPPP